MININNMWLFISPDTNANENNIQDILLEATGGDNIAMIYNASKITADGCEVHSNPVIPYPKHPSYLLIQILGL